MQDYAGSAKTVFGLLGLPAAMLRMALARVHPVVPAFDGTEERQKHVSRLITTVADQARSGAILSRRKAGIVPKATADDRRHGGVVVIPNAIGRDVPECPNLFRGD